VTRWGISKDVVDPTSLHQIKHSSVDKNMKKNYNLSLPSQRSSRVSSNGFPETRDGHGRLRAVHNLECSSPLMTNKTTKCVHISKGKVHPCTGTEVLYRPYGP
jgi:hypothetical protein